MMDPALWLLFALAYLGITFSPGPNVLVVLNHTAKYGYRHVFVPMAGNLSCQLLIIVAIGVGIGSLLTVESAAYHWMKIAGALYLIYLGARIVYDVFIRGRLKAVKAPTQLNQVHALPSARKRFLEAFAVSASNPKTVIFLSAFLPQFISPEWPIVPQFAIMYLTIAIIVISVHYMYAFLLIRAQRRFSGMFSSRLFPGLSAAIYLFLGVTLGVSA
ncbi:RhtB family transporter [Allorhizobium ampelinum]|nr:LysE family translocator [Allorhizobium ampelinum]NSZ45745.1 LysE family translocator [Agrobacterium vitis]NTA29461.1 LysE family translocator [Allorhizobium ampelinum]OVE88455.1 RhtB family transporter [Allorhizobium ampelinum]